MTQRIRIGDLLLQDGLITQEQLEQALRRQKEEGGVRKLGDILSSLGFVSEEDVCKALHHKLNVPMIDLSRSQVTANALNLVPRSIAEQCCAMPITLENGELVLAMSDPVDYYAIDRIQLVAGKPVSPRLATPSAIRAAILRGYRQVVDSAVIDSANRQFSAAAEAPEPEAAEAAGPVVELVNAMFRQAVAMRASDIHIEPQSGVVSIRFRIDGELITAMSLQPTLYHSLVTRIKLLSGLDIAEKRIPQDGRFTAMVDGTPVQMRTSSLPTIHGEKLVLRVFGDSAMQVRRVSELGMNERDHALFMRMIQSPSGIVLVAGPTGSGKTTTLYAALCEIQRPGLNLCSIEDPVEKEIHGVNQVQVNSKAGLTFAAGLRSLLRQDPDIIMIGEIRDAETASIAVRAAITGHLVFSTIHTNDAASTFARLVDMGVEPYMVSASMVGVVSQRLVKLLCPNCKRQAVLDAPAGPLKAGETVYQAVGCERCNGTGYRGRTAVYEQLPVSETLRGLIARGAETGALREQAKKDGCVLLQQDIAELVRAGRTSVDELMRLTYSIF